MLFYLFIFLTNLAPVSAVQSPAHEDGPGRIGHHYTLVLSQVLPQAFRCSVISEVNSVVQMFTVEQRLRGQSALRSQVLGPR